MHRDFVRSNGFSVRDTNVKERKRIGGGTGQSFCQRSGWIVFEAELAKTGEYIITCLLKYCQGAAFINDRPKFE